MAKLTLLVVSDIHAGDAHGQDTYVTSEPPTARVDMHPLSDLVNWVDLHSVGADYLVVAGDIANRADSGGLSYAWSKLQQLARSLGAQVIAAPGNHDVTTRAHVSDPREALKKLLPTFPLGDPILDQRFWTDGFVISEFEDHRFVVLDSTSDFPPHPGVFESAEQEEAYQAAINQGGIAASTLAALENELRGMSKKLNVLVLHHHPLEHQLRTHMRDWHGPMRNGGELAALLSSNPDAGRWLVIHGHKHIPQLVQDVRVNAGGPVVLCAASLGHHLWAPATSFVNNQFHIVHVADDRVPGVGSFTGTVRTFNWGYSFGWQVAPPASLHLPPFTGFGYIPDVEELALSVKTAMKADDVPILRAGDIASSFPMVKYLAPADRQRFEVALHRNALRLELDESGGVSQIAEIAVQEVAK